MDLGVQLGDLFCKNPILTASGTFGYGLEFESFGDLKQLGGIIVKGLSLAASQGNPPPRITETSAGLLNSIGLHNIGVKAFVEEKLPSLPWQEVPIIVNLYAQTIEEFSALTHKLAQYPQIAALEANISCPNVSLGGIQFGQDPVLAAEVTRTVKEESEGKPVIVKLSPNVSSIVEIAKSVEAAGADIISLINTLKGMSVDVRTKRPSLSKVFGGLSGPAIKPVALAMVYQVCQEVDVPVIGVGGIASAEDALEFILVGAHAVQVGSANFIRPDMAFSIISDLERRARELGLNSWQEFRGSLI
ncbi:MAG TPA: dihydroorotate dehydrogenase, partial [Desulfohalobiaceae bacterium]|nr:dihydroorotate dehydrogenase [Desulfohalobiaceae bacterium]